jgi:hypothetical protein
MRISPRRASGLALLAAAATMLAACAAAAPAARARPRTRIIQISPVTAAGTAAAGFRTTSRAPRAQCEPGSEAIGQAYRCAAGNALYDPCWPEKAAVPAVLCLADPWSRTDAELTVSAGLAAVPAAAAPAGEPWGLQVAGGQRCVLLQGAHSEFGGQVLDYSCGPALYLLRGLNRSGPTWTARSVIDKSGHMLAGPEEKIAVAWYGRPVRFR